MRIYFAAHVTHTVPGTTNQEVHLRTVNEKQEYIHVQGRLLEFNCVNTGTKLLEGILKERFLRVPKLYFFTQVY